MECNMGDHRLRRIDFPSSFRYTKHKQNAPGENLFLVPEKSMIYNDDKFLFITYRNEMQVMYYSPWQKL